MIHTSDTPAHGDFLAYIERVTGKPPASPEPIVQTARGKVATPAGFPDFELAKLAPIGRGLSLAGFAVIAAAILLDEWLPLPSPFAGVVLVLLGVMLRRLSRGAPGSGGPRFPTRRT